MTKLIYKVGVTFHSRYDFQCWFINYTYTLWPGKSWNPGYRAQTL